VEHPANLPRYFIVAAGIVRLDQTAQLPVYNNLSARVVAPTTVLLNFKGYRDPSNTQSPYIVKVLPVRDDQVRVPIVKFLRFDAAGVLLDVADLTNPIPSLSKVELMIEISQYEGT